MYLEEHVFRIIYPSVPIAFNLLHLKCSQAASFLGVHIPMQAVWTPLMAVSSGRVFCFDGGSKWLFWSTGAVAYFQMDEWIHISEPTNLYEEQQCLHTLVLKKYSFKILQICI